MVTKIKKALLFLSVPLVLSVSGYLLPLQTESNAVWQRLLFVLFGLLLHYVVELVKEPWRGQKVILNKLGELPIKLRDQEQFVKTQDLENKIGTCISVDYKNNYLRVNFGGMQSYDLHKGMFSLV